jgi:hypothetical protein
MSSLDWETLRNANFDSFSDVAAAWSTYASEADLRTSLLDGISVLKDDGGSHERDDFDGETAEAVRAQAKRIVELWEEDIEGPARISALCTAAAEDFKDKQTALEVLIGDAGVYLSPAGGIGDEHFEVNESDLYNYLSGSTTVNFNSYQADEFERRVREDAVTYSEQFKDFMAGVRVLDDQYDADFRALNDDPPPLPPFVGSPDYLEKAAGYDAANAAEFLAGGEDGTIDAEDIDRANALLEYWGDDPRFATPLMNEIGAEEFAGRLTDIQFAAHEGELTSGSVAALYEGLGVALATATSPSSEPHVSDQWVTDLMNSGDERIAISENVWQVGYQALAPVLEHGVYDSSFIVPVADHILALDKSGAWSSEYPTPFPGESPSFVAGLDNPVNSVLTALDHNPQASLDFFQQEPVDLEARGIDGVTSPVENPLGYLFDQAGLEGPHQIDADRFGNAIEAAATGLPSGTELSADLELPLHDPNQAEFVDRVMEYAVANDELFSAADGRLEPVLDNFGDITAHYMADIHQAMTTEGAEPWLPDSHGIPLSIAEGGEANLDRAADWLRVVGQDPDAMASAWAVSEGMLYGEIAAAGETGDWKQYGEHAVSTHALVSAALTEGGLNAIADGVDADADDRNARVDDWARAANFGAGLVVGATGADVVTGAAAGVAAGEVITAVANEMKTDPGEVASQTVNEQNTYYEAVRGSIPVGAMEQAITDILEGQDPERSPEISEVYDGYIGEYKADVNTWMSAQEEQLERAIDGQITGLTEDGYSLPPEREEEGPKWD